MWGIYTITIGYSDSFGRSPHTNPESLPPNAHTISGTQGGDYRRPLQTVNSKNANSDPALLTSGPMRGRLWKAAPDRCELISQRSGFLIASARISAVSHRLLPAPKLLATDC